MQASQPLAVSTVQAQVVFQTKESAAKYLYLLMGKASLHDYKNSVDSKHLIVDRISTIKIYVVWIVMDFFQLLSLHYVCSHLGSSSGCLANRAIVCNKIL